MAVDPIGDGVAPRGMPQLKKYVKLICRILVRYSALYTALDADFPTVATALRALTAACTATGFDMPDERFDAGA